MKITFVLPFINLTGGIRVMLDYANWLHDAGHDAAETAHSAATETSKATTTDACKDDSMHSR